VWRDELRFWQQFLPKPRKIEEIMAIGSDAMQENHDRSRLAARKRFKPKSVEFH
jgi:hypothetical protein